MNRSWCAALGCLSFVAAGGLAYADQAGSGQASSGQTRRSAANDDSRLEEVIVTGTRSGKAVDQIPGAITVVSPEEVLRTLALTEDATAVLARTVPGYSESSQAINTLGETLRGRVPLRLLDGIPQSTPLRDGSRNGTFTDMDVVGRIEVINGPSATEGIGAAGGIINYLTKKPSAEGTRFSVTTRLSSQLESDSEVWKVAGTVTHKSAAFDLFAAASFTDRGITYDSNGRRIGLSASSSAADSKSDNFFLKVGKDFGADEGQRLQLSLSRFKLRSKGGYSWQEGNRARGLSDTAVPGAPLGTGGIRLVGTEFNDFRQYVVSYSNADLWGGYLTVDLYKADQAMRFPADNGADRQDPLIAPLGTLVDQSEIASQKRGLRTSWTRPDLFAVAGLELQAGLDLVEDETEQSLALTNRVWVPPLNYSSLGPFAQLSYDLGPVTINGGIRREDGELSVDDYTTTFFRNRAFVRGGKLDYKDTLLNGGLVWRVSDAWSAFASYSEGFTLPNVGIPLRNINVPGKTVATILDLQAIVFDNSEVGFSWRGQRGSASASYYESSSDLGAALSVDPVTRDFVLNRAPVEIKGFEFAGEFRISDAWKVNAIYSQTRGKTTAAGNPTGPLNVSIGVVNISPDKLAVTTEWRFSERGALTLGTTQLMSRRINQGTSTAESIEGYTLVDLTARYETEKYGAFSLGVENLTDNFYFLSFSQIDFFRNYFAGRGRSVSLTYRIDF